MSDLLPPNRTAAESALAETVGRLSNVPIPIRPLIDPAACPAHVLPWLAWAWSLDDWDPAWTEAQQRAAVAASVDVHRHKGTIGAVKRAVTALGFDAEVREWWATRPQGSPYTFELEVHGGQTGWSAADLARLQKVVSSAKNLRSHMTTVAPVVTAKPGPHVAAVAGMGNDVAVQFGGYNVRADGAWTANGAAQANGLKL